MKRASLIWCAAMIVVCGFAHAQDWNRSYPTLSFRGMPSARFVAETTRTGQDAPILEASPAPYVDSTTKDHDGYPFTDRCGCGAKTGCADLWSGYSGCGQRAGCWFDRCQARCQTAIDACGARMNTGLGRIHNLFGYNGGGRCGKCGVSGGCGCDSGCSSCASGGRTCMNSFAGGGCGGSFGGFGGLCGTCGKLPGRGCRCGGHAARRVHAGCRCGRSSCKGGCGAGVVTGGGSCGCGSHGHDHVQHSDHYGPYQAPTQAPTEAPMMSPPVVSPEQVPQPALDASGEKSAYRPYPSPRPVKYNYPVTSYGY